VKVLLSIKPKFVESIIKGNKKYEYRKAIFKKNVDTVVIYKTTPFCKIIGEFEIDGILYDTPENIWQITQEFAGITQDYFDKYFYNRKIAYAIKIGNIKQYELEPKDIIKQFKAPQSFMYWDVEH
jgi:predicted transcriptional regulator